MPATIELWLDGDDKDPTEFNLRPFSLKDEVWTKDKYGDEIDAIFKEMRMKEVCEMVFRLLVEKNKLPARHVKEYDDDGVEVEVLQTGPQRVMEGIRGINHKIAVFSALMKTIGLSKPLLNEVEKKEVLEKKKDKSAQAKKTRTKR